MLVALLSVLMFTPMASADEAHPNALTVLVSSFGILDVSWRELQDDIDTKRAKPAKFATLLREHATKLSDLSNSVSDPLRDSLRDCAKVFRDVADDLDSNPVLTKDGLSQVRFKLMFVAHIAQGIALGIIDPATQKLRLTDEEIKQFHSHVAKTFGSRVEGNGPINGDTPFAQAVSLINNFIKVAATQ